ncbi:DUF1539 domain-containing protein [Chlamydia psittaci]|uniref:DUF1539 domain-containing protein n=1 Tax=Chlamydia psittaci TaxID=83554 RepID=UPI00027E1564|nr:DUF1539 domain-containing protein [Chlamydia psittaci]AFS24741.1 hypothetical protein B602_0864 [Chlamydia psittaci M56]
MSLENNNFRAAFAHPQPASALHGTSLIKTANQKISFLSIFNALGNKIGSCLCLNPESDSKAGWVFAFVLSTIITVLLCILLLPLKLILLGLSCCPCLSKPTTGVEATQVTSSSIPPVPPAREVSAFSQPPVGLDASRFSPGSFIPVPPLSPPSIQSLGGVVSQEITLREFLETNYPTVDLNTVTLDSLGITLLTLEDLPEGTTLLDLPASLLFGEGSRDLSELPLFQGHEADSAPVSLTGSLPSFLEHSEDDLEDFQDQGGGAAEPTSLVIDTSEANPVVEVNHHLSGRELLNRLYPNTDHTRFINSARVNLRLQGILGPHSDDDILNLPAVTAFPDLVAGQPARPSSLTLTDTPASLASLQAEPVAPPPSEELISPSDPRYTFLQNHFPELEPEYYSRHISLLASLSGVDEASFNLLELPLEAFIYTTPTLDYEPISSEDLQERLGNISPEEYVRRNNEFIQNLLENTPNSWTFLNRLRTNITNSTQSADLRRQWFSIIDMIVNKTSPELEIEDISNTARAYLFRIHYILKNNAVPIERKADMLKYIASHYDPDSVAMCLVAMQQEIALQNEITPQLTFVDTEEGAASSVSSPTNRILPPLAPQATPEEVDGYIQLLRSLLSGPMFIDEDNIHLAPDNDLYLESLMREVPDTWGPIHQPLEDHVRQVLDIEDNRILQQVQNPESRTARLAQNQQMRDSWHNILLALSSGSGGSVSSNEAQALSRSIMYQMLKLISSQNIPHDKKLSIISNVASYSYRCPPTWVRVAGQELQAVFNTNDETTNIVLVWAQMFKEGLLSEIFRNQPEWHMMTAFKIIRGSELGLDNVGIILDPYTTMLTGRQYTNQHNQYFSQFLNVYRNSGEDLINSALEQALGGSEDQIQALTNTILADLVAAGIPEAYRAQIMEEVFFSEENDYKPSREAICYLLLKEGIITTQNYNR